MRLLLSLAVLFVTWISFASAQSVVCVPISAADGPPNSQGITPINCQIVANKTIIACYPTYQVNFPQQFPTRVSCTPMEPTTTTSTTTTTTKTTTTVTTTTPSTTVATTTTPSTTVRTTEATTESSLEYVLCLPISSCGCGHSDQGVEIILCIVIEIEVEIRCYPRFPGFSFGQSTPIECLPLDEITTTESTTEEPTTTELAETTTDSSLEYVFCLPISPCGCGHNDQNVDIIICIIVDIDVEIRCYPRFIDFLFNQTTPIECLPVVEVITEAPTTTKLVETEEPVICVPYAEIEGAEPNENGIKPIYCMLISNHTIIVCCPVDEFIFFPGPISQRILCVPVAQTTPAPAITTEVAETTESSDEFVLCLPISPCECGNNAEGVEIIICIIIDIDVEIRCSPRFPGFTFNQSQPIECLPLDEITTTEITDAPTTTELAETPEPVICVPYAEIEGAEPNEDGIKPIYCMLISNHTIIVCCPVDEFIFFPGPISQRILCVPVPQTPATPAATTEVSTVSSSDDVICIPFSPCDGSSEESNEEGVKAIYCIIIDIDIIVKCFPKVDFIFNQTSPIHCEKIEEVTLPSDSSSEEEEVINCIPFRPCEGSSEESNEEGVDAIFCIIEIDIIVKCFPKISIGWVFNQTMTIECVPVKEVTASPPTPTESGESEEEEESVICVPISQCEGSSEESNEEGIKAIYCVIVDIDIIVKCFPKGEFIFNQTRIECVPLKETTVTPPAITDSGEEEGEIVECVPFSPCEGSSEESNEEGVKAIYCLIIDINIIVKCFPKVEVLFFNQTKIECVVPPKEITATPPTDSGEEEEIVDCIPFSPCEGSSEESNEEGVKAIYCLIIDIDIIVKCFPKVEVLFFNQTKIECVVPPKEITATPPTDSEELEEIVDCIPFSPCEGSSEESNEKGVKAIYCLVIDIIVKCYPKIGIWEFNQTATIECIKVEEEATVLPSSPSGSSEEEELVFCIPFSPCEGSSEESNEEGVKAIFCIIIDIDIIVKCFPKGAFVFNQTAEIECVPVKDDVTVSPPTASGESEEENAVDCIPVSPCEGSSEESNENGVKSIMCWIIDIQIVVKCFPKGEGWSFNQTETIKCLQIEETTAVTELEEASTAVSIPPVVFCIPFSPCGCGAGANAEGNDAIKCLIIDIDFIIICYPKTIAFAFNQTETIECATIYEEIGSSTEEETTVAEIETSSTGIVVPDIVFCIPFSPCPCGKNDQGHDAIQCLWIDFELVVYCYPTIINFSFNQTATIECATVSEDVALLPTPSTGETVACIPFSPCSCGNDGEFDAIQCLIPQQETIVTCYPHTIAFNWNQTATIDCTTVV